MNPLSQYPGARRAVYTALWALGLFLTVAQVWVATLGDAQPGWLSGMLAAYPLAAAYVGYQAQQNTPAPTDAASSPDGI